MRDYSMNFSTKTPVLGELIVVNTNGQSLIGKYEDIPYEDSTIRTNKYYLTGVITQGKIYRTKSNVVTRTNESKIQLNENDTWSSLSSESYVIKDQVYKLRKEDIEFQIGTWLPYLQQGDVEIYKNKDDIPSYSLIASKADARQMVDDYQQQRGIDEIKIDTGAVEWMKTRGALNVVSKQSNQNGIRGLNLNVPDDINTMVAKYGGRKRTRKRSTRRRKNRKRATRR